MSTKVGEIDLELILNSDQFKKAVKDIQGHSDGMAAKMSNTFSKLGKVITATFSTAIITKFGKDCIELGSDLAEVQNVVDVVYTKMSTKMNKWAKEAAATYGLSETMAKKYAGTFGAMSKAFGFTEEQAYDMSTALTGLTGDVASFYNLDQDTAYTKLKSVFTGETESLKDLGVVMTQTALDSYALANGFGKTTSQMTETEKVSLRYAFVTNQLASAQGDFARTSDGWANQIRVLKLRFDSLKATLGQGLINVFNPVIKLINILMSKLSVLSKKFKAFTEKVFGSAGESADATSSLSEAVSSVGDEADNTAYDIDGISRNTEKAKRSILGFDKLNILSGNNSDDSTNITTTTTGTSNITASVANATTSSAEKSVTWLDRLKDKLKQINFTPLKNSVTKLWEALKKLFSVGGDKFKVLYEKVLKPLAKWTIEKAVPKIVEAFAKAIEWVAKVLGKIKPNTLVAIGSGLIGIVSAIMIFKTATAIISGINKIMSAFKLLFAALTAHPILAVVAAVAALVVAAKAYDDLNWQNNSLKEAYDDLVETREALDETSEKVKETAETFKNNKFEMSVDFEVLDDLSQRLKDIIADGNIDANEQKEFTTVCDVLKDRYPDFKDILDKMVEYDSKNGTYKLKQNAQDAAKAIDEMVNKYKSDAINKALSSGLSDLYSQSVELKRAIGTQKQSLDSAMKKILKEKERLGLSEMDWFRLTNGSMFVGFSSDLSNLKKMYDEWYTDYEDNQIKTNQYNELQKTINQTSAELNALNGNATDYVGVLALVEDGLWSEDDAFKALSGTGIDTMGRLRTMAEKQKDAENKAKAAVDNTTDATKNQGDAAKVAGDVTKTAGDKAADGWNNTATSIDNARWSLFNYIDALKEYYSMYNDINAMSVNEWSMRNPSRPISEYYSKYLPSVFSKNGITIPHLAEGGVIPPNDEFLVMYGDQRSGKNIEAPERLLRKIVSEETMQKLNNLRQKIVTAPIQTSINIANVVKAPTLACVGSRDLSVSDEDYSVSKIQSMLNESSGENVNILKSILDYLKRLYEMFVIFKNNGGNEYEFIALLDGSTLFDEMIKQNELYKKRHSGKSAFA